MHHEHAGWRLIQLEHLKLACGELQGLGFTFENAMKINIDFIVIFGDTRDCVLNENCSFTEVMRMLTIMRFLVPGFSEAFDGLHLKIYIF